jgi:hypothetical protein
MYSYLNARARTQAGTNFSSSGVFVLSPALRVPRSSGLCARTYTNWPFALTSDQVRATIILVCVGRNSWGLALPQAVDSVLKSGPVRSFS